MALQVMDKLGIEKAFALGTSQGGWIVTRMALLAPDRVGAPAYVNYLLL
jgi:microsomal epoxide hydrolase